MCFVGDLEIAAPEEAAASGPALDISAVTTLRVFGFPPRASVTGAQ
jgi:hypothetical protein